MNIDGKQKIQLANNAGKQLYFSSKRLSFFLFKGNIPFPFNPKGKAP